MKIFSQNIIKKDSKGFTLIELLVVIGILAVLIGIILVAMSSSRQFAQADNARRADDTKRANDIKQILYAISAYTVDNKGSLPNGITSTATDIGDGSGHINICSTLVPVYISALPQDPMLNEGAPITTCSSYDSGYQVSLDGNGRVTISAPHAALSTLSVTR